MERNKVNENKDQTCSYGLHFAAYEYAEGFGRGGRMMIMKINPKDVVSIPSDYNNQKGRCCKYEVLAEVDRSDSGLVGIPVMVSPGATKVPEVPVVQAAEIAVGSKVIMSAQGRDEYSEGTSNPYGVEGTVTESGCAGSYIYAVQWPAGSNSYREGEIALVVDPADWQDNLGSLPVPEGTMVEVTHNNGDFFTDAAGAEGSYAQTWDLGLGAHGISQWRLVQPAVYAPQADNYADGDLWDCYKGCNEFLGKAKDFPVNRQTVYELERDTDDDSRGAGWFFTAYHQDHDNLVFRKHNGAEWDYVTVADVDEWTIEAIKEVYGS
jgi:hypothetical protein